MMVLAVTAVHGQNAAVNFVSSNTVRNVKRNSQVLTGAAGALGGRFDRDNKLDFVFFGVDNFTVPSGETYEDLAHNNGDGTFTITGQPDKEFAGRGPELAADLNGDGITDLVNYEFTPTGLDLFGKHYALDTANSLVLDLVSGDFNGDGRIDLAALTSTNKLVILLNDGGEVFHLASSNALPAAPSGSLGGSLAVGDLDGNGRPDLLLTYAGNPGTITPFFSSNTGAFHRGGTFSIGATVKPDISVAIGDLNQDGYGDAVILTPAGVKVMLGSATGAFHAGTSIASPNSNCVGIAEMSCVVLADFNKDGKLDLAVAGAVPFATRFGTAPGAGYVKVYFGDGAGSFNNPFVYSAPPQPAALIAADVNGTGNIDLVTADASDGSLNFLRNNGTGHFLGALSTSSPQAAAITSGDFNRDGKRDIAVLNTPSCKAPCHGTVTVFPGSGKNYFNPGSTYTIGMHGSVIAAGDLNGDGVLDLVVKNATPGDTADTSVLLGNTDGTFRAAHNFTLGSLSNDIVLVDMNKDGKLDLVEYGGVDLGKGDGSFGPPLPFFSGTGNSQLAADAVSNSNLAVGDFNSDGKLDVVILGAAECSDTFVNIFLGDGKGGFTAVRSMFPGGSPIQSVAAGRLRPGGPVDVVYSFAEDCGSSTASGVIALLNDGQGNFTVSGPPISEGGRENPVVVSGPVVIADFNGDGIMDIGAGVSGGRFRVSAGNGDGNFQGPVTFTVTHETGNGVGGILAADFTGDGRPDVVLTSRLGVSRLYNVAVPMVSPGFLTFRQPGSSKTVTVKNTLSSAQTIGAFIKSSDTASYSIGQSTCHGSIAPGASCTVTVVFDGLGFFPATELLITDGLSLIADIPLVFQ
jgi:hypothetical protein